MTGTVTPGRWLHAERPLLDRGAERAAIDDLLNVVRRGFGGVLVLRGGQGVGKTTLADYAVGAAPGFQVSVIAGVESEIQLEYGAVHQLLIPFLPLVDDLPVPQREAIRVAFGLEAGPVTGGFFVGLACLTLLAHAAADQPVLCVVDDANWIDAESALALGFVARRLYADRVGMILTVGEGCGPSAFGQLPAIEVGGLTDDAAAELLRSVAGAPLDSQTMDRVLAGQISGMLDSHVEGMLLACRGEPAQARAAGLAHIRQTTGRGQGGPPGIGEFIVAIADLRAGDFEAAYDTASEVVKDDLVTVAEWTLPELIEAAVRSGHHDAAASAFATLASRTSTAGTPWALGVRARCQALLADGAEAEDAYAEAISQLGRCRATGDLARAHLLYGQWLRRANRRRDARGQLRTAHAMFEAMGADGFAGQAASELRATGERARSRTPDTELDLTGQEAKVANLAADGATNNEIAAQLFISASTVHYHLSKVFRKLGITGRGQLAHRLPGR